MNIEKSKSIIEAILFACGREVETKELMTALELSQDELFTIIDSMKQDYENENRGIEIIKVGNSFQLTTKKDYYEYIYPIFDKRSKPNLTNAALETLAIIAYNPKITRAEIESIRGVGVDNMVRLLLDRNLIKEVGKKEAPGRPTLFGTTKEFLKLFRLNSIAELPKLDEDEQERFELAR